MKVFYSPEYVGAGYAFDTTRKSKWIADSLSVSPIEGIELTQPEPLSQEQIEDTHVAEDSSSARSVGLFMGATFTIAPL